jgi:hypothetical protein
MSLQVREELYLFGNDLTMLQNASASTDSLSREAVKDITLSLLENFKMVKEQNKGVLFLRVILNYPNYLRVVESVSTRALQLKPVILHKLFFANHASFANVHDSGSCSSRISIDLYMSSQ